MKFEYKKIGKIGKGQDGCIYGSTLFRFDADGSCNAYDLDALAACENGELSATTTFKLDKADVLCPHSNAVSFGKEKYAENDEFPLLYTNIYNTYNGKEDEMWGVCCVYRLSRDGDGYKTTLVQIIEIGFSHDPSLWCSFDEGEGRDVRPFGNFTVDAENGRYYGFVMRDKPHLTRFLAFDLPRLSDGTPDERFGVKRVTLTEADILSQFDCDYANYIQGACCHNGILYSVEGFGPKRVTKPATLMIVDPEARRQIARISLIYFGIPEEPELIDFTGDRCIYADHKGNLFEFFIEL